MKYKKTANLIKGNKNTTTPCNIIYLDTETYVNKTDKGNDLPFRLAVTCYVNNYKSQAKQTEKYRVWFNPEELCDYISSKTRQKTKLYIFGHNIFFDGVVSKIFSYLTKLEWEGGFLHNKGKSCIAACSKDEAKIVFVSSTNFYPYSLKHLGEMLGIEKLDIDFNTEDLSKLTQYCKRDVEILKAGMESHFANIEKNDWGNFRPTIPSQAFAAYKHRFMRHKIYPTTILDVKQRERTGYHGGRVECFVTGEFKDGPFIKYDFNSNYPYVMRNNAYPTQFLAHHGNIKIDNLSWILKYWCVSAEVVVNTDVPMYPIVYNNKLIFPIGEFKTIINTRLLIEAIKRGHIVKILWADSYKAAHIFKEYVEHFYPLKQKYKEEGNTIMAALVKLLMNALYGKFAQQNDKTVERVEMDGPVCSTVMVFDMDTGKNYTENKFLNKVKEVVGKEDAKHTSTIISSHVTEDARLILWELIETVGVDKVLYCDTDSIIIRERDNHPILDRLDRFKLGYLSEEIKAGSIKIDAPKHYKLGDEVKMKGVPKNAIKIGPNKYEYEEWPGLPSYLRKQNISEAFTTTRQKTLTLKNTKRKFSSDGASSPFLLPDDVFLLS